MINVSILIKRPLNKVWDYFIAPDNWKNWNKAEILEVKPRWETGAEIYWGMGGSSIVKKFINHQEVEIGGFATDIKYSFLKQGKDHTVIEITISDPKGGMTYTDGGLAEKKYHEAALSKLKSSIENETISSPDNKLKGASSRTIRDFEVKQPILDYVDKWSGKHGFDLSKSGPDFRLYKKGNPALKAPLWVQISQTDTRVHLEVWLSVDEFTRKYYKLMTLFIFRLKPEYGIESGGNFARIPKKQYRAELNELLAYLGQPPVL